MNKNNINTPDPKIVEEELSKILQKLPKGSFLSGVALFEELELDVV